MAAPNWLSEALKQAESESVTRGNQVENAVLVTDLQGEFLINKGLAGFVTSVTSVTKQKEGIPLFSAERKRLFSANDPTPDLTPRYGWLIHFTDREPVYATYSPEATHAEVLRGYRCRCRRSYGQCAEWRALRRNGTPTADPDDRITCRQCENFTYSGICTIARPGGPVSAQKGYRIAGADMRQRCPAFQPIPLKGTQND
jgi:hypothetical protein